MAAAALANTQTTDAYQAKVIISDALGNKVNEYSSGPDAEHGPIMGVDYSGTVQAKYRRAPN